MSVHDIVHSVLAPAALARRVLPNHDIEPVRDFSLLSHNQADLYQIETSEAAYVMRVYRARDGDVPTSLPALLYELELLLHLKGCGVPVSAPVAQRDGRFVSTIAAPEGTRSIVLFHRAPGTPLSPRTQSEESSEIYGRVMAMMHDASNRFESSHPRPVLDVGWLIDKPLSAARSCMAHRPDIGNELQRIAGRLSTRIADLATNRLDFGACHGDLTGGNANLTERGLLTFYDFEYCGPGWRAYDVAVFRWALAIGKQRLDWGDQHIDRLWSAFLRGYRAVRALGDMELAAIPALVMARQFWYLGLRAVNQVHWGAVEFDDHFLDELLASLREWDTYAQSSG